MWRAISAVRPNGCSVRRKWLIGAADLPVSERVANAPVDANSGEIPPRALEFFEGQQ
jgi:hypothetical protein